MMAITFFFLTYSGVYETPLQALNAAIDMPIATFIENATIGSIFCGVCKSLHIVMTFFFLSPKLHFTPQIFFTFHLIFKIFFKAQNLHYKKVVLSCIFYSCVYKNVAIDWLRLVYHKNPAFTKCGFKADLELRLVLFQLRLCEKGYSRILKTRLQTQFIYLFIFKYVLKPRLENTTLWGYLELCL